MAKTDNLAPIIIVKKIKKVAGGHHGGAWKVAYADFVTAMMAFFLLLWLLSSTTEEQKQGISEYFTFATVSQSNSGAQGVLGGNSLSTEQSADDGAPKVSIQMSPPAPASEVEDATDTPPNAGAAPGDLGGQEVITQMDSDNQTASLTDKAIDEAINQRERQDFEKAEQALKRAIKDIPELSQLSDQLIIDHTPDGMRIQLVDQADRPMFKAGTATPYARTFALFREISKVINRLPNRIAISGHTDATPYRRVDGAGNWEVSMERALVSRRALQDVGISSKRFFEVTGKADTEPLFPDDPFLPGNRRISITLMKEAPALAPRALSPD